MELDYEKSIDHSRLDKQLGIKEERLLELLSLLDNEAYPKAVEAGTLGEAYAIICNACNNIEEYTLCMHVFVFKIARTGMLKAEYEHIRNQ